MSRAQSVLLLLGLRPRPARVGSLGSVDPATTAPTPRVAFVTIGSRPLRAQRRRRLHQLWSQQLFANALPPQSVYANLATSGATAAATRCASKSQLRSSSGQRWQRSG